LTQAADSRTESLYRQLKVDAEAGGYNLNPDVEFTMSLVGGLAANEERIGYQACPCRLAAGERSRDLDIICPCDYRDTDLEEYGQCYCALYVSDKVMAGEQETTSIPERRPPEGTPTADDAAVDVGPSSGSLTQPVWRCRICGYLCARESPPEKCPICKADKDRFERFM
jgi:ferredoxin-thioredoxin reductase catalytic subunit